MLIRLTNARTGGKPVFIAGVVIALCAAAALTRPSPPARIVLLDVPVSTDERVPRQVGSYRIWLEPVRPGTWEIRASSVDGRVWRVPFETAFSRMIAEMQPVPPTRFGLRGNERIAGREGVKEFEP